MRFLVRWVVLAGLVVVTLRAAAPQSALPYRFLLVVGDQWKDETSTLIDRPADFQVIAALMKSWGLPFDILRLDQQQLDRYHLLDREGRSRYGAIIWAAAPAAAKERDLALIGKLVHDHGAGLIAIGDAMAAPEIAAVTGLSYVSEYRSADGLTFGREHFITRGLAGAEKSFMANTGHSLTGRKVTAPAENVIASRGAQPFLTARQFGQGRAVWLGAERTLGQLEKQIVRDLLKRALVWTQGYALYREYGRSVIMFTDDFGASDKTALSYWHYRTPSEEEIRRGLIEPLQRRGAVIDVNVITGYADRKTGRILVPWTQRVADEIDPQTTHDFPSTRRGLEAGIKAGVFQIESHGWTHMLPDLESPPGPWWTAPMDGTGSLEWYNEFGDNLRKRDIPAIVQQGHMHRSLEHIREDFGVVPLILRPGGSLFSHSFPSNTARIAAQAGFALTTGAVVFFLSPERVILLEPVSRKFGWAFDRKLTAKDIPWSDDAPHWVGSHDRDLAMDSGAFARLLSDLGPDVRYIHGREYAAYLHARVQRTEGDGLALALDYDPHYCAFFATHESRWTLHVSDETRQAFKLGDEKQFIDVPRGTKRHVVYAK